MHTEAPVRVADGVTISLNRGQRKKFLIQRPLGLRPNQLWERKNFSSFLFLVALSTSSTFPTAVCCSSCCSSSPPPPSASAAWTAGARRRCGSRTSRCCTHPIGQTHIIFAAAIKILDICGSQILEGLEGKQKWRRLHSNCCPTSGDSLAFPWWDRAAPSLWTPPPRCCKEGRPRRPVKRQSR